jgi:hypothetical protein
MTEAAKPLHSKNDNGADGIARRYVNHIALDFSLSEVHIDLGQAFAGNNGPVAQCKLVTSPVHLRQMNSEIAQTITQYETRFGNIPTSSDDGKGEADG